ncbi:MULTISPECIES: DMT family transporter [Streptomyces]|uniref:DMT family transporter n=1 Tax=Streptomyces TaxID=1883 RepID=UPI000ABC6904|nr:MULTISPECIES: DMT family transporter [unclassified Streptomyces]MDX3068570.1 DMT family transporter [Streptomyces sp. ND04-05B]WRY85700.1 DMT family transporter [Streptomyces clavifer]
MSSLALAVLLSLVSAVAYAAGAIVQERVAAAGDGRPYAPLRNGVWWVAVALNGVGAVLHVVALAYGPLSLVQPLGALTIVFALPMAALFVRRRAGWTAWRGALMATVGLAGLLALTGSAGSHTLAGAEQLMLATTTAGAVVALLVLAKGLHRPMLRSVVLATGAGIAFGIASVFTKTVAVEWTTGAVTSGLPTLLVIAGLAAAGLLLSQAAYRGAGLTAPLATVTVVNPVVAAAVGLTLFGEQFRYGLTGTLLALACGALAAAGLVLLTTERVGAERRTAERLGAGPDGDDSAGHAGRPPVTLPGPVTRSSPSGKDPSDPFPAPSSLSPPLTGPLRHGARRVEFGEGRPTGGSARRGGLATPGTGPDGTVQTLAPPARR